MKNGWFEIDVSPWWNRTSYRIRNPLLCLVITFLFSVIGLFNAARIAPAVVIQPNIKNLFFFRIWGIVCRAEVRIW